MCETGNIAVLGKVRDQARGGPREEERKARREAKRNVTAVCLMRRRVGWATWIHAGGAVTCTDCHSQTGHCTGADPLASRVKAGCRELDGGRGAPAVSDVA